MAASELSMFPYFIIFLVFLLLYFLLRNYLWCEHLKLILNDVRTG
jgi:hypothetical protein